MATTTDDGDNPVTPPGRPPLPQVKGEFREPTPTEDAYGVEQPYEPASDFSVYATGEPAPVIALVPSEHPPVTATPYVWQDPAQIPMRKFLFGRHLIRGKVSLDVAAGGIGKSILKIVEAISMATGRDIIGKNETSEPLKVWLFNLEDEKEELDRRIAAVCQHYAVDPAEFAGNLFVDSGLDQPCITATINQKTGTVMNQPCVQEMIEQIKANRIDVVTIDPFVSSHGVPENDNMAIDAVVKRGWVRIASECQCAVNLVHHIRKGNGEEATAESARGAKALTDAARSVIVFNRMSKEEAEKAGVQNPRRYFRIFNDKANLAPPLDNSEWYELVSVDLPNGDQVGVPARWEFPSLDGEFSVDDIRKCQDAIFTNKPRADMRSNEWAGHLVADVMGWDAGQKDVREQIKNLIEKWIKDGLLYILTDTDKKRMKRHFVAVKKWVDWT